MPSWDPQVYLRFAEERTRPASDLAAAVALDSPVNALDVGCGPANSTAVLKKRWSTAKLTGLDSSEDMLTAARKAIPNARFILRDINEDLSDIGTYDLVFSNAVLQWVPDGYKTAACLFERVRSGGALAVQVPYCAPLISGEGRLETGDAHRILYEISKEKEFAGFTDGAARFFDFRGEQIYNHLSPVASRLSVWETRYCHVLDGYQGLAEWYRGTGMRPYLDALPDGFSRNRFQRRFLERTAEEFSLTENGKLLFWFRRLFFVAYKF